MPVPTRFPGWAQDLLSASWRVEPPTPFSAPLVPSVQGPCSLRMRAKHPLCPKPSLRPGPDRLRMSSLKDSHGWTLRMALVPLRPSLPPHHDPPTPAAAALPALDWGPWEVVFPRPQAGTATGHTLSHSGSCSSTPVCPGCCVTHMPMLEFNALQLSS